MVNLVGCPTSLISILPASIERATFEVFLLSLPITYANPYLVSLAILIASSKLLYVITEATGQRFLLEQLSCHCLH